MRARPHQDAPSGGRAHPPNSTFLSSQRQEKAGAPSRTPARVLHLQVFQSNEREGGPHGDAEGEPRDQSRDALAVQHTLSSKVVGSDTPKDTPACS
jgi:hypothetical protein